MLIDVCGGRKTKEVMQGMWGHLAPKKGKSYRGYMIYAHSAYGDIVLINAHFENLSDSPWLFESMQDFIAENGEKGNIYKWAGLCRSDNEGKIYFNGKISSIKIENSNSTPRSGVQKEVMPNDCVTKSK